MDEMKELIDERVVERVFLLLAVLGPSLGLVIGGVGAAVRRRPLLGGLLRGVGAGALGTLIYALWRLFSYTVRYEPAADPAQDYFGLERVDVLLGNLALFIAVGAVVGWLWRGVARRTGEEVDSPTAGAVEAVNGGDDRNATSPENSRNMTEAD